MQANDGLGKGQSGGAGDVSATWSAPVTRGAIRLKDNRLIGVRVARDTPGVRLIAIESRDAGKTWSDQGEIASDPERGTDLGDGALTVWGSRLVHVYRRNHTGGAHASAPDYAIDAAVSSDSGKSWKPLPRVTGHALTSREGPSRGLWAPFPTVTPDQRLFCIYDDENAPFLAGFRGHQWLMGRFFDERAQRWSEPVVVSRAHEMSHLSRDGMATVAIAGRRMVCVYESVDTAPPHPGCIRAVTSDDSGKTWSWARDERAIVYQPANRPHMALAPFVVRLTDGSLLCAFGTDADRETPDRPGTPPPRLHQDIRMVKSRDNGKTWSAPMPLFDGAHRNYLVGLIALPAAGALAHWIDFERGGWWAVRVGR